MSQLSIDQAHRVLNAGGWIEVDGRGKLSEAGYFSRAWTFLNGEVYDNKARHLIRLIGQKMEESSEGEESAKWIQLAERVLPYFEGASSGRLNQAIVDVERIRARLLYDRLGIMPSFLNTVTRQRYEKWRECNLPLEIFFTNSEFTDFLFDAQLLPVFRMLNLDIYDHTVKVVQGEPQLCIGGEYRPWSELRDRFEVRYCPIHREKFIFERESGQVWSYLGGRRGLSPVHPYGFEELETFTVIGPEQYRAVLEKAKHFERPDRSSNEHRDAILQVVSSSVGGILEGVPLAQEFTKGYNDLLGKPRHPWMRLIRPNYDRNGIVVSADVKIVGFGWTSSPGRSVARTGHGRFRLVDLWECKSVEERHVTNIATSGGEADHFLEIVSRYQSLSGNQDSASGLDRIGFNLIRQNCSVFVKAVLSELLEVEVEIEVTLPELFYRVLLPTFVRRSVEAINRRVIYLVKNFDAVTPELVKVPLYLVAKLVEGIYQRFVAFRANLLLLLFGGLSGEEGYAFYQRMRNSQIVQGANLRVTPLLQSVQGWFSTQTSAFCLPSSLQRGWQVRQGNAHDVVRGVRGLALASNLSW